MGIYDIYGEAGIQIKVGDVHMHIFDAQKELLKWLDKFSLAYQLDERFKVIGVEHQNSAQSAKQALRRLVEKFYGEWQGMAQGAIKEYWIDNELANTISYKLSKEIRDFDPMLAEDKEKIKVEGR